MKPSAMAQVHNRVNAGIMDAVTCGGMMEGAEPESDEYVIAAEGDNNDYFHVQDKINESTDCVKFDGHYYDCYFSNAIAFMSLFKKDGSFGPIFVGPPGNLHGNLMAWLVSSRKATPEEYGRPSELKINDKKTGRFWFGDGCNVISFYSYDESPQKIYNICIEALQEIQKSTGEQFNMGQVMVDLWTKNVRNPVIMPVRWFNNGMADIFLPTVDKCVPYEDFSGEYKYKVTTSKGVFSVDWTGDDIEQENEYYSGSLNESSEKKTDYQKYIKSFIDFLHEQNLKIDPLPEIKLDGSEQDGLFIKTGYYSPEEKKVVAFTYGRALKDVMRTIAHEFIHHMQNLENPNKDWSSGGDLEDDRKLRGIEGEAFLLGNILFREWTEQMKKVGTINESRKKIVKNDKGEIVPEKCDKCGGDVVCQIHGEPVYICKDCGKYFGTMSCNLNESINPGKALKNLRNRMDPAHIDKRFELDEITTELVEPDDVDLSSFNIKKHLNPKFWDGEHLDTRIRLKLLDIADDFFDSLGVDWVEPEDVIMTGSLANYNWNEKYSDIDLHVLVDYEDVDERTDFVREYFAMKKNQWNEKHKKLKIFGFPVEVYVQDVNEPHASSGVYSVDKDKWLTEPDLDNLRSGKVDKKHVREMVSTYMNKIDSLIDIYKAHKDDEYEMKKVHDDASDMMDEIKELRRGDLKKYGREMCDGNLIFKALRRSDYIGKLIKLKDLTYDKINSI